MLPHNSKFSVNTSSATLAECYKETQTSSPIPKDSSTETQNIGTSNKSTLKVFEFNEILKNSKDPSGITIIKDVFSEEIHNHSDDARSDDTTSNRYTYCREVIKPYLKHYPKDCPVPDDQLLRDALEAVHLDFPDYQPCFDSEVNSFDTVISSKNSEFNSLKSDISHKMGQNKMVQTDGKNDLTDPVLTQQNIESTIMLSKSKDKNIFQGPQKDTVQSTTNIMSTEVKDETLAKNYIEDFIKDSFHKAYQTTKRAITVLRPESIKSKDVEDGTNDGKKIEAITNYTFSKKKDLDLNSKVNEETTNDRNTEKFIGAIFNTVVSNLSVLSHHENLDNSDSSNQDVQDHNIVNKAIANEDVSSPETSGLSSGVFMLIKSKIASLLGGGEHEKKTTATTTVSETSSMENQSNITIN